MSRAGAVLLVWLLASCWTGGLHLRATLDPPAGRAFAGTFHWIDDFYHYLSYVQQAQDGHLLFRNKLAPPGAPALLFNLEWWLVGSVSRVLGGRPLLAYGLFGAAATLALVAAAERWLSRLAVPPSRRTAALVLTAFGGGLGGLLFEFTTLPVYRCPDLSLGLYPFLEIVGNPHFVAGTALLLWSAWLFSEARPPLGPLLGIVSGSALALVRPYEIALLVAMRGVAVLATVPPARRARALLPLVGLLPALAYDVWVFFARTEFATFLQGGSSPGWTGFAIALGPAALLAAAEWRRPALDPSHQRARAQLSAWAAICILLALVHPRGVPLQLLVGCGVPLLLLAAAALCPLEPRVLVAAALCFATSAVVETRILLQEDPNWFVPGPRLAAARALAPICHAGDRLLAPPDVSLFGIGLSSCSAYVAHPSVPGFDEQVSRTRAFYGTMSPTERQAWLDSQRISHLVLPGWAGPIPVAWLGPGTPFRSAAVIGALRPQLSIYTRTQLPDTAR